MSKHEVKVSCQLEPGFSSDQVLGMFDLKRAKSASESFSVEVPADDELIDGEPWRIGVVVGPSGSGKTTVAREVYGKKFQEGGYRWSKKQAVVDNFGKTSIKDIVQALTAVGFSSPPSWVKPYHVLSGGERFRCDLARALLSKDKLVAFDEFTSVVDRNVAKIGSAAVAKSIRKNRFGSDRQFVAVSCHYDILDWLEPDWVLDMNRQKLTRGRLRRRPTIELEIRPVHPNIWSLFKRHHYLNTKLMPGAKCFAAFWNGEPVAFSAWLKVVKKGMHLSNEYREHRTVVLPDYQGASIGNKTSEACASILSACGFNVFSTTSHPSMIHYRQNSPQWKVFRFGRTSPQNRGKFAYATIKGGRHVLESGSYNRVTGGFQYVGEPMKDKALAKRIFEDYPENLILRAIASRGQTSINRIVDETGYTESTAFNFTNKLIEEGKIRRYRAYTGYAYETTEDGKKVLESDVL